MKRLYTRNYAYLIQRHLNKETEQVKSTWLINRGSCGTCVGVTRTTVSTDRNVKMCRDMSTGDSRNSTPPLLPSSCEACRVISYIKNPFLQVKFFFVSPSPPFYILCYTGSASLVLLYFIVRPLTCQARSIA